MIATFIFLVYFFRSESVIKSRQKKLKESAAACTYDLNTVAFWKRNMTSPLLKIPFLYIRFTKMSFFNTSKQIKIPNPSRHLNPLSVFHFSTRAQNLMLVARAWFKHTIVEICAFFHFKSVIVLFFRRVHYWSIPLQDFPSRSSLTINQSIRIAANFFLTTVSNPQIFPFIYLLQMK